MKTAKPVAIIESNFLLDLRLKTSETTAIATARTVKMMKNQAGLINHAKIAKITESTIATIGKIRLKRGLSAEPAAAGLGTVQNP